MPVLGAGMSMGPGQQRRRSVARGLLPGIDFTQEAYATWAAGLEATGCTVSDLGVCSDGSNHVYGLAYGDAGKPCVFLTGCLHGGHEWRNAYTLRQFMTYLVSPPTGYEAVIAGLLADWRFFAIPCANPYGYIHDDYGNANVVNLNRNFDRAWEEYDDTGLAYSKGSAPFSEVETQFIRDAALAQDPVMFLDNHIYGAALDYAFDGELSNPENLESAFWANINALLLALGDDLHDGGNPTPEPKISNWGGLFLFGRGLKQLSCTCEASSLLTNARMMQIHLDYITLACQQAADYITPAGLLQPDETSGYDNSLYSPIPDRNYGTGATLGTGLDTAIRRGLLKFDLSWIGEGETIASAILTLYCESQANATPQNVSVHRALTQWYEGLQSGQTPSAGQDASTWSYRNYNGSVAWGGAGANGGEPDVDFDATPTDTVSITGIGAFAFDVTADVQAWHAGTATNYGWFILGVEAGTTRKTFTSSSGVTAANRPKLQITFA